MAADGRDGDPRGGHAHACNTQISQDARLIILAFSWVPSARRSAFDAFPGHHPHQSATKNPKELGVFQSSGDGPNRPETRRGRRDLNPSETPESPRIPGADCFRMWPDWSSLPLGGAKSRRAKADSGRCGTPKRVRRFATATFNTGVSKSASPVVSKEARPECHGVMVAGLTSDHRLHPSPWPQLTCARGDQRGAIHNHSPPPQVKLSLISAQTFSCFFSHSSFAFCAPQFVRKRKELFPT